MEFLLLVLAKFIATGIAIFTIVFLLKRIATKESGKLFKTENNVLVKFNEIYRRDPSISEISAILIELEKQPNSDIMTVIHKYANTFHNN